MCSTLGGIWLLAACRDQIAGHGRAWLVTWGYSLDRQRRNPIDAPQPDVLRAAFDEVVTAAGLADLTWLGRFNIQAGLMFNDGGECTTYNSVLGSIAVGAPDLDVADRLRQVTRVDTALAPVEISPIKPGRRTVRNPDLIKLSEINAIGPEWSLFASAAQWGLKLEFADVAELIAVRDAVIARHLGPFDYDEFLLPDAARLHERVLRSGLHKRSR